MDFTLFTSSNALITKNNYYDNNNSKNTCAGDTEGFPD